MTRRIPYVIGLVLVVLSGLAHGLWTGRWLTTVELEQSVERLAKVPMDIGDWHGTNLEMDEREKKGAGIVGIVYRRYQNTKTNEAITLFLASGPAGPIAVHSPQACYPGVGYTEDGEKTEVSFGNDDQLFVTRLSKESALSRSSIRIYYGWNGRGPWIAPNKDPRFIFAGVPVLYKMYIIQEQRAGDTDTSKGPGYEFGKLLLPQLRTMLFENSQS